MADISRQRPRPPGSSSLRVPVKISLGNRAREAAAESRPPEQSFPVEPFKKPRNWQFQTRPLFKRVKGPLVDVFHEAEEVLIVIDLGSFSRGEVDLHITPEGYCILAQKGDHVFREKIRLPPEVDIENCLENFRNGVIEIVLPRKKKA